MSGARVDKSFLSIFIAVWPENLLMPQTVLFHKKYVLAKELEYASHTQLIPLTIISRT